MTRLYKVLGYTLAVAALGILLAYILSLSVAMMMDSTAGSQGPPVRLFNTLATTVSLDDCRHDALCVLEMETGDTCYVLRLFNDQQLNCVKGTR